MRDAPGKPSIMGKKKFKVEKANLCCREVKKSGDEKIVLLIISPCA